MFSAQSLGACVRQDAESFKLHPKKSVLVVIPARAPKARLTYSRCQQLFIADSPQLRTNPSRAELDDFKRFGASQNIFTLRA